MFSNLNDLLGIRIVLLFMQVYHIVSLLLIIEYILTAATTNCSVFHVKFLVQLIMNILRVIPWSHINVTQFSHGIKDTVGQGYSSWIYSLMDLWCNLSKKLKNSSSTPEAESLPHNSWEKELLIKLAWLTKPGVKKTPKVQVVWCYFVFFVWFAGFSKSFTAFATTSSWPFLWIYSLLSITTNGRMTWRFRFTPKDFSET